MKKIIITIIIITLMISFSICGFIFAKNVNRTKAYTRTCEGVIIEVDGIVVVVETADGHVWEFEGDGFEINQKVNVVFSNNGSPDCVKDDIVQWVG